MAETYQDRMEAVRTAENPPVPTSKDLPGYKADDFTNDALSPYTARSNGKFNHLGAALFGGGGGLLAYMLARMLGIRPGGAAVAGLAGLGLGLHRAYGKQFAGPMKYNPLSFDYIQWARARSKARRQNVPQVTTQPVQSGGKVNAAPTRNTVQPISPIV